MNVNLSKAELNALISTADQMKDDLDYYSFMGKKKLAKFEIAYNSGMRKLRAAYHKQKNDNKEVNHE